MAKLTVEKVDEYPVLPPDKIIQVEVVDVTEREVTSAKGDWMKFEFKFRILAVPTDLESDYGVLVGSHIWGSVPARLTTHPDNKLRQWSESLLNMDDLPEGYALDTDDLIGKRGRALISNYEKRDGKSQHQVNSILPFAPGSVPAGWGANEKKQEQDAFAALAGAGLVAAEEPAPF
jgi:hypothetical protein